MPKDMVKVVPHYGIHWSEDGVAYLMQGRGSSNAIGKGGQPPFQVRLPNNARHCNHMIPLAVPVPSDYHWNFFARIVTDDLVHVMLPLPKTDSGVYYLSDAADEHHPLLVMLSKLSSPIYNAVVPVTTLTADAILTELQNSNVQPFVVTNVTAEHAALVNQVAKGAVYLPRKVIFSGAPGLPCGPQVRTITTTIRTPAYDLYDLIALPWESLGATVVRKFMRREWHPAALAAEVK